ncbi:MAG: hypothetical protein II364_05460 [Bacteroidales bacterium]|nr:hypothetical protein [Bacteroidales bacterium]
MKRMYAAPPTCLTKTASCQEVYAGFYSCRKDSLFARLVTGLLHYSSCYLLATLAAGILFILCSCRREEPDTTFSPTIAKSRHAIEFSFAYAEGLDKPESFTTSQTDSILFFSYHNDSDENLDSYSKLPFSAQTELILTHGPKTLVALYGFKEEELYYKDISSLKSMRKFCALLEQENPMHPRMSGMIRVEAGIEKNISLKLEPLLSEIVIKSLRADFSGQSYEGLELDSVRCYLCYANCACPILETDPVRADVLCNYGFLNKEELKQFSHPEMLVKSLDGTIGKSGREVDVRFNCYPHRPTDEESIAPFTRLVIEANIGGDRFYYPIDLEPYISSFTPQGMLRNKSYQMDIILTRLGSKDPDQLIEDKDVFLHFSIYPWERYREKTEKF